MASVQIFFPLHTLNANFQILFVSIPRLVPVTVKVREI